MHKKLFAFGRGSMAMVLDAELRRPLKIDLDTLLNITLEGNRIVIERSTCDAVTVVEEPPLVSPSGYDRDKLGKLISDLDAICFSRQDFARLAHDSISIFEFAGTVSVGGLVSAVTIARLEAFFAKRQARVPTDQAIEAVLIEFPDELHWPRLGGARRSKHTPPCCE